MKNCETQQAKLFLRNPTSLLLEQFAGMETKRKKSRRTSVKLRQLKQCRLKYFPYCLHVCLVFTSREKLCLGKKLGPGTASASSFTGEYKNTVLCCYPLRKGISKESKHFLPNKFFVFFFPSNLQLLISSLCLFLCDS